MPTVRFWGIRWDAPGTALTDLCSCSGKCITTLDYRRTGNIMEKGIWRNWQALYLDVFRATTLKLLKLQLEERKPSVFPSHLPSFESTDLSVITNSNICFKPTKGWVLFTLQLRNENICFYVTGLVLGLTWKLLCSLPHHTLLGHRSRKCQVQATYWMNFLALDFFWLHISIYWVGPGTHFFDLGLLHLECWGKKCYLNLQTNFHFHTTKQDRCPLERRPCHPFKLSFNPTAHGLNKTQHKHLERPLLSTNTIKCAWLLSCILFEGPRYRGHDFLLHWLKQHHPTD